MRQGFEQGRKCVHSAMILGGCVRTGCGEKPSIVERSVLPCRWLRYLAKAAPSSDSLYSARSLLMICGALIQPSLMRAEITLVVKRAGGSASRKYLSFQIKRRTRSSNSSHSANTSEH